MCVCGGVGGKEGGRGKGLLNSWQVNCQVTSNEAWKSPQSEAHTVAGAQKALKDVKKHS